MKKFLSIFAVAGLVGLAACGGDEQPVVVEEAVFEEAVPAPIVVEAAPMATDTVMVDSVTADTTAM